MGLLDGISDPDVIAALEERQNLAEYLARAWGGSFEHTIFGLILADERAMERYAVGNTIPWRERH